MKNPRHIVVKTLMNADEFLNFEAKCKKADVSHSRALRDLAIRFSTPHATQVNRRSRRNERPSFGQVMSMILPSRASKGMHMRL